MGVADDARPARPDPRRDRLRRLLRRARRRRAAALLHPGPLLRRARRPRRTGPAPTSTRASGRGPSGGRRDGRFVVETERGAILARDVFVATNGYTDGVVPVAAPADHPDRQLHHRQRAAPRGRWHGSSRRRAARSSTPRTSCTTGTSRPTGGWSSAGGPASCRPRSTGPRRSSTAGCSRSIRSWPATGSSTPGAATSGSPSTGCRTSGGPRDGRRLRDGLLRHRRRPDDPPRARRSGSGWPAARRRRSPGSSSRWSRRRTRAGRGSCRSPGSGSGSRIGSRPARDPSMRVGFRTSPQNVGRGRALEAAWAEAGRHDVFDSGWLNDHLGDSAAGPRRTELRGAHHARRARPPRPGQDRRADRAGRHVPPSVDPGPARR